MPPQPSPPAETRRRWLAVLGVTVVLCCVWTVPVVAGAGPDAPVETPTPPVETPTPPVNGSAGPVTNATEPVPVATPNRTEAPAVPNGSKEVRTAVEGSTGYVDDAANSSAPSWESVGTHLGPLRDLNRSRASTSRLDSDETAATAPATAPPTDGHSPTPTSPTVTPASAAESCVLCGPVLPAGVVLLGLAGSAGAAASLGLAPQSTVPSSAAVRYWLEQRVPRLPPVVPGRFGRGGDTDPLDHTHRRRLRDLVDDTPGVHLGDVVEDLSLSRSSVRYHVRVLEDAGELETTKLLGRRRLFPPDADSELLAALADDGARRVVQAVARVEPASVGTVVDETNRAYSTVSYHLDRLEAADVVDRERDGRRVTVELAPDVADLLPVDDDVAAD